MRNVVPRLIACLAISVLPAMSAAPAPAPLAVNVTNTEADPVQTQDVDNPAFQPFQKQEQLAFVIGVTDRLVNIPVPAGKRLVIEFVSFQCLLPIGQNPTNNSIRLNNAVTHFFLTPLQGAASSSFNVFMCSTPTRLYCDPGSSVQVFAGRNTGESAATVNVSISGHYVNVP